MKRFFLAALAIAAIASCTKNEVNEVTANDQITFQTVVGPNTKALIDGTAYNEGHTFGTVAYKVKGGSELYIPISEVSYNNTQKYWSTTTPYYWPKDGSTLTFYSYSPFKDEHDTPVAVSSTANGLTIANYGVGTRQNTDLMVADAATSLTANTTEINPWKKGVPTIFEHKLAQVVAINFKTVEGGADHDYANGHTEGTYEAGDKVYIINTVKLINVFETGTYTNASGETWTSTGEQTAELLWHNNTSSVAFSAGKYNTTRDDNDYLLVLPQTFETTGTMQQLEIKYTIKTYTDNSGNYATESITKTINMHEIHGEWDMNMIYTYTISIGTDRIYWAPSIVEWETDDTPAGTI